jgi:hypothetical protein
MYAQPFHRAAVPMTRRQIVEQSSAEFYRPRAPEQAGGHEGRHFLVPRLDEFDFSFGAVQRAEHAIDAIPGIAENVLDALGVI